MSLQKNIQTQWKQNLLCIINMPFISKKSIFYSIPSMNAIVVRSSNNLQTSIFEIGVLQRMLCVIFAYIENWCGNLAFFAYRV